MKNILLSISTTRQSSKAIQHAINEAKKENAKLIILFIVNPDIPLLILDKMMDMGFMGDSPSKQLYQSLLDEYKERGSKILDNISEEAKSKGVKIQTSLIEGEFIEECLKIIKKEKPLKVILTRSERSNLSRFLFGSAVKTLKNKSPSAIEIIDEY